MKKWKQFWIAVLAALLTTLMLSCQPVRAEIINGYGKNIKYTYEALENLKAFILDESTSKSEIREAKASIKGLMVEIAYFELTEDMLSRFRLIAPGLYNEIDAIVDSQGRPVDVYVKFVPQYSTEVEAFGTTYINHAKGDKDLYHSEYGEGTVSVKIWVVYKALLVLAHELGHTKHQIPNLASYMSYYMINYGPSRFKETNNVGHDPKDPSGNSAIEFERRFQKIYRNYLKKTNRKFKSPIVLFTKIKNDLKDDFGS